MAVVKRLMAEHWSLLLAASVVVTALVPLLLGGTEAFRVVFALPVWGLAAMAGLVSASWLFAGLRVHLLCRGLGARLPYADTLRCAVSAEFAAVTTPAYMGWAATWIWLLVRRGLRAGEAGAVVALDQILDLLFFSTAMPVMVLIAFTQIEQSTGFLWLVALPFLGLGAAVVMMRHYRPLAIRLGRMIGHRPRFARFRWRLARGLIRFRGAMSRMLAMGRWQLAMLFLACTFQWCLRYSTLPLVLMLLGSELSWAWLFLIQGLSLFAGHAVFMPGGAGGVEAAFTALLAPSTGTAVAASALLGWRLATFHWQVIAGAPFFLWTMAEKGPGGFRRAFSRLSEFDPDAIR